MPLQFNREISLLMALTNYLSICMDLEACTVWLWRFLSLEMWHHAVWKKFTNVSEKSTSSRSCTWRLLHKVNRL